MTGRITPGKKYSRTPSLVRSSGWTLVRFNSAVTTTTPRSGSARNVVAPTYRSPSPLGSAAGPSCCADATGANATRPVRISRRVKTTRASSLPSAQKARACSRAQPQDAVGSQTLRGPRPPPRTVGPHPRVRGHDGRSGDRRRHHQREGRPDRRRRCDPGVDLTAAPDDRPGGVGHPGRRSPVGTGRDRDLVPDPSGTGHRRLRRLHRGLLAVLVDRAGWPGGPAGRADGHVAGPPRHDAVASRSWSAIPTHSCDGSSGTAFLRSVVAWPSATCLCWKGSPTATPRPPTSRRWTTSWRASPARSRPPSTRCSCHSCATTGRSGRPPTTRSCWTWPAWTLARLPPLIPVGTTVGTIRSDLAERLGLPARAEVSAGTNDTSTDAVAAGALEAGRCGLAIGTTSVLVDTVEAMKVDLDHEILSMPGPFLDQYLVWAENGLGGRVVQQVLASLVQTDDALGADGRERPVRPVGHRGVHLVARRQRRVVPAVVPGFARPAERSGDARRLPERLAGDDENRPGAGGGRGDGAQPALVASARRVVRRGSHRRRRVRGRGGPVRPSGARSSPTWSIARCTASPRPSKPWLAARRCWPGITRVCSTGTNLANWSTTTEPLNRIHRSGGCTSIGTVSSRRPSMPSDPSSPSSPARRSPDPAIIGSQP